MNSVNKTLYIPLYGKAYVSRKGLFLQDKKAEEIWDAEGFSLKGKSKSKWLAYYMGIRSAVFDDWLRQQAEAMPGGTILHLGCGLDSRVLRTGIMGLKWYDVDFPEVIAERKRYYTESDEYKMLAADLRSEAWHDEICGTSCIVVMEGVSMYMTPEALKALLAALEKRFEKVALLMDCYTAFAAKMSAYKNPVKEVGVSAVYGVEDPAQLQTGNLVYIKEREMTPQRYIDELHGMERKIFSKLYAGGFSKKLYRLFEYRKG